MSFADYNEDKKCDKRFRLTEVPRMSNDGKPKLQIFSNDKRKIAEDLVNHFSRHPNEANGYNFKKFDLSNTNLAGLDLRVLGENALRQINFSGSNMPGQNFEGLNLRGAKFKGATMEGTNFEGANLEGANLEGACLVRCNFEACKATGVKMNNADATGACLNGMFAGAEMNSAKMQGCFLGSGNFFKAQMNKADMNGATTFGPANFQFAQLVGSKLNGDFRSANFFSATMMNADMEGGDFTGASFCKAMVIDTKTAYAKLDVDAFSEAINYGDLGTKLDVNIPKPSFNSKTMRIRSLLNKLGPEAPAAEQFKIKQHKKLLDQFPTIQPPI